MATPLPEVLTVTALNNLARLALERALPITWVAGEISNFTRAASGHWYFTLKDAHAAVRCAMFRNRNQFVDWRPENGLQVEVKAQATLYEARGEFQLGVEAMRRAGLGALFEAFQRLKEKLSQEGLFDPARKRPLPPQPQTIGIVTSPLAAALGDVLTTLRRRWPAAGLVIYPTPVQGAGAAAQIAAALAEAGRRGECQVLLLVRGGGSIEDLWAFNEEVVARAIVASPIPVVTGVGHETDFTIADFAADVRAPTPTGAAQLATPDRSEMNQRLDSLARRLEGGMERRLHNLGQHLDSLARQLRHPAARLASQRNHLAHLTRRLALAQVANHRRQQRRCETVAARLRVRAPTLVAHRQALAALNRRLEGGLRQVLERHRHQLDRLASALGHLNPAAVLDRGYSLVRDGQGQIVRDSDAVAVGDILAIDLAHGALDAAVVRRRP